jgi:heme/copper-type cytochrome/quinol oxidase subunit 2
MRIILMFLPVLIPLFLYLIIYSQKCREAANHSKTKPKFVNDQFFKFMVISLLIGVVIFIFIFLDFSQKQKTDNYRPARVENGIFLKGK